MLSKASVALVLVALLLIAGCGDSQEDQAMADVCAARDDITKQVDELKNLTVTTATTDAVSEGLQAIRDDLSTIGDATAQLSDERRDEVETANDEFAAAVRETLRSVGTSVSVADASSQVKTAFSDLESTYRSTFGQLDCT